MSWAARVNDERPVASVRSAYHPRVLTPSITLVHALAFMLSFMLSFMLVQPEARAAPAPEVSAADEVDARPRVLVLVDSDADRSLLSALEAARTTLDAEGLVLALEHLEPGQVASVAARQRVEGAAVHGVFWVEVGPGFIDVWLRDRDEKTYLRRVPGGVQSGEAAWESVWLIVESGAESLSRGGAVAMEPTELPQDPDPPPPMAEPTPAPVDVAENAAEVEVAVKPRLVAATGLSLSYLGEGVGSAIPWQSGLSARGFVDLGRWPRLGLEYAVLFPPGEASSVSWRHRVSMHGGVRRPLGARWAVEALAELGLEAQRWRSPSTGDEGWRAVATSGVGVAASVRLRGPLWFWVSTGVGIPLNRVSYVECRRGATRCSGEDRRVALTPWPVGPRIRAGFVVVLPRSLEGVRG